MDAFQLAGEIPSSFYDEDAELGLVSSTVEERDGSVFFNTFFFPLPTSHPKEVQQVVVTIPSEKMDELVASWQSR